MSESEDNFENYMNKPHKRPDDSEYDWQTPVLFEHVPNEDEPPLFVLDLVHIIDSTMGVRQCRGCQARPLVFVRRNGWSIAPGHMHDCTATEDPRDD